jgi:hypothetical protein
MQELIIANAVFFANCMNNPHMKPYGSKRNMSVFQKHIKKLVRKLNKNEELTFWDKVKIQKKKF